MLLDTNWEQTLNPVHVTVLAQATA